MRIAFHLGDPIICGGILVPVQYIGQLRKIGYDAFGIANWQNDELTKEMGIPFETTLIRLEEFTEDDVIIAVRWEFCDELEGFRGRKVQFVQGNDRKYYEDINHTDLPKLIATRNNPNWELIGVSAYCLKDWGRGIVIPNGINERFFINHNLERDIDILVEGNNEPNKNVLESLQTAKSVTGAKIAWMGRETAQSDGVQLFTNPNQEDIPKIYQRSKVTIKRSHSEGFSLPILEAMASGCIVITKDMGGNMDFCQDNYNCRVSGMPAYHLRYILDHYDRVQYLRDNGYKTAKEFTWENSTSKLINYLKQNETSIRADRHWAVQLQGQRHHQ